VIQTANEIVPLFGRHHAVVQRVLAWSTLTLSVTFALGLTIGAYVRNPWNVFPTITVAGLVPVLVGYDLARWQLDGIRWLMYTYATVVVSVVLIFAVKFFRNGSTSGLWEVAPIVGVATVVLGGTTWLLRRSQKRSVASTKGT
jgi:NADH:ubiquinone oxidoreductase subunit 5 (subunit L)/multisubunit Na+/H+ antiporter MnhA subunit